jgi:TetR/AcrR family transcriptional regulator
MAPAMTASRPEAGLIGGRGDAATGPAGRIRRANEARLLDAAETVFAERGYGGATTAAIARRAGLPKANLHYYFRTKEAIYRAVLDRILQRWLAAFDPAAAGDDPAAVLEAYVRGKIRLSREHQQASRVFAREILSGASHIRGFLVGELRRWVERQAELMQGWIAAGRMDPIDPVHLLFIIWAATQTYADFDAQIRAVTGKRVQARADFEHAADTVVQLVLKGCGVRPPAGTPHAKQRRGGREAAASPGEDER